MRIWLIDHYSVPVKYYPLARNTIFAKYLSKMGHEVIIFAASTVHNSSLNLINDNSLYKEIIDEGTKYVIIKCHQYSGNGLKRIFNMYEFAHCLGKVCKRIEQPDVIISTSMTLFACKKGIKIGKKLGCKTIAQITDLWPESLIAYGIAKKNQLIVKLFRKMEKWIYTNSGRIIFSMEGAYNYICEQGWDKIIPSSKVDFINNGVDLCLFDYNKNNFRYDDEDLLRKDLFKVVYTGSIRKVNNLGLLLDTAKLVDSKKIVFLIWGDGDEKEQLEQRIVDEKINNVFFKGKVDKRYIPYITSCADLNIVHSASSPVFRFGISMNKMFDYCASGKPILCDFESRFNPVVDRNAGIGLKEQTPKNVADAILYFLYLDKSDYENYCNNARKTAELYNFANLSEHLMQVINKA